MSIKEILEKWKRIVEAANDRGIPLPMVRDPNSLEGSVSLTLVVFSTTIVMTGIMCKWAGLLGGIDMNSAFNFFYASTTLYFGHSWVHKDSVSPRNFDDPAPKESPNKPELSRQSKADDPDA